LHCHWGISRRRAAGNWRFTSHQRRDRDAAALNTIIITIYTISSSSSSSVSGGISGK